MNAILKTITEIPESTSLLRMLQDAAAPSDPVQIGGMVGSLGNLVAGMIAAETGLPVLIVVPSQSAAEKTLDDVEMVLNGSRTAYLPPSHMYPLDRKELAHGPRNERVDAVLRSRREDAIIVTQPEALLERYPSRMWIDEHIQAFEKGRRLSRDNLIVSLGRAQYQREVMVDSQGQFAVRGAIIDIFPYGHEIPVRIEFDEDEIVSLRLFDPATQRSRSHIDSVSLLVGADQQVGHGSLFDLLPDSTIIMWHAMEDIRERIDRFHQRADSSGLNGSADDCGNNGYPTTTEILQAARSKAQVVCSQMLRHRQVDIDFDSSAPSPLTIDAGNLALSVGKLQRLGFAVSIMTDTEGEKARLYEMLAEDGIEGVRIISPTIANGFQIHRHRIAVLTAHELFRRRRRRVRHTRFRRRSVQFDRSSLLRGDLVVHTDHGIGRYEGLRTVSVRGQPRDCLRIRYAGDVILYIKVEHFNRVEKYTGMENARPTLSRIGGAEWQRAKRRTRKAIKDIADELLKLYAKRKVVRGYAFPEDTHWQREMESSFEFDDTPDQITSSQEIKADLQRSHPMDRLLCGDVGFGKTEVAIRAAFKVVQDSMQAAVLVPTTILAQQHYETFRERLSPYPVRIEVLSRFRTPAQQRDTIRNLKTGAVDIVIGTHRLLSRDVGFRKLGLLVVDEEHRFGVRHKERIKQLMTDVDVLTMTATPIPRTLHMALMGARDTSQINTPPVDRLPIQTEVHAWSEELIRDAILYETDRDGQVFFLHNRVQSIYSVKSMLERLVPGVRYGVAHGQMKERELEKVMFDFMHGRYDVLVTTIIIESGLDIPNTNTLIVNRADRFGLAQLYQLRGRIGRSNRQAYAYLLTPPRLIMTADARRRLGTLTELTELGSGLKVAMRDLEIRGAGNILGSQQSGFINTVGFDLYTRMLDEVVHQQDGSADSLQAVAEEEDVKVEFDGPALFPRDYIEDSDLRYDFYRRISTTDDLLDLDKLREELIDRFGELPAEADNLLKVQRLRMMGRIVGLSRISVTRKYLSAAVKLPTDDGSSRQFIGRLVALADPFEIEFKLGDPLELLYRFNLKQRLDESGRFLRHLSREGILRSH